MCGTCPYSDNRWTCAWAGRWGAKKLRDTGAFELTPNAPRQDMPYRMGSMKQPVDEVQGRAVIVELEPFDERIELFLIHRRAPGSREHQSEDRIGSGRGIPDRRGGTE